MSQLDPEVEEEETPAKKKTGSAYWAGRHDGAEKGDSFTGSYRGVKPAPHGGAQHVKDSDLPLGASECWCGRVYGHDWEGKSQGKPHPRGDVVKTEEEVPHLTAKQLKSWDRQVVRALVALVNTYGVRYRIDKNQMHMYLSAPGETDDGVITRFKASRSSKPEHVIQNLEKWAVRHIRPAVVDDAAAALAAKFNDPTKKQHPHSAEPKEDQLVTQTRNRSEAASAAHERKKAVVPTATAAAPEIATSQPEEGAPEGYHTYMARHHSGEYESNWWQADDETHFLCKSCDYTVEGSTLHTRGAHQRMHSMTPEERADVSRLAKEGRDEDIIAKRTRARNMIKFLAAEFDVEVTIGRSKGDTAKTEKLEAQLAKVTAERDEAKARLALMKEALGA